MKQSNLIRGQRREAKERAQLEIGNLEIHQKSEPMEESEAQISHLALDIGGNTLNQPLKIFWASVHLLKGFIFLALFVFLPGSLIKLVYFSRNSDDSSSKNSVPVSNGNEGRPVLEGKLHFAKFETAKIHDCIDFIQSKQLCLTGMCMLSELTYLYFMYQFFIFIKWGRFN